MELTSLDQVSAERLLIEKDIVIHKITRSGDGDFLCAGTDTIGHSFFRVSGRTVTRLRSFETVTSLMTYYTEKT